MNGTALPALFLTLALSLAGNAAADPPQQTDPSVELSEEPLAEVRPAAEQLRAALAELEAMDPAELQKRLQEATQGMGQTSSQGRKSYSRSRPSGGKR